ncbi:MAG: tetratricopeptide repeat protein [Myxococcota bacterium]
MTVWMLLFLPGCDNSAAEALRTCEGGNTEACYNDGMAAASAARPRFGDARKAFAAACRPSVGMPGAGSAVSKHRPKACNELAILVRDAKGGPKDLPRAIELFEISCKDGMDQACVDLGALLYNDDPERVAESARAVVLFESACAKVDPLSAPPPAEGVTGDAAAVPLAESCDALGHAYQDGIGVEPPQKDEDKAAALYAKACDARYARGCVSAGALAVQSKQKPKEKVQEAAVLFERACKLDARQGCFELAELHANKAWPDASDAIAAEFYQKTCNMDPTRGCFEAGALMEEGRVQAREGEIASLYNLACEHGHTLACARRALVDRPIQR